MTRARARWWGVVFTVVAGCGNSGGEPDRRKPDRAPDHSQPARDACGTLRIDVTAAQVVMLRSAFAPVVVQARDGWLDEPELSARLADLAAECVGPVALRSPTDTPYTYVVAVMNQVKAAGFTAVTVDADTSGGSTVALQLDLSNSTTPVLHVSVDHVALNGAEIAATADDNLASEVTYELRHLAGSPGGGSVILEVEASVPYATITTVMDAAKAAGYPDAVLAIK